MRRRSRHRGALAVAVLSAALLGGCRGEEPERRRSEAADRVGAAQEQAEDAIQNGWVTTKVQAKFFADENVKGRNIDVTTRNGVVTLEGRVESELARQRAVELAQETEGVQRVENRLSVQPDRVAASEAPPETARPAGGEAAGGTAASPAEGSQTEQPAATSGTESSAEAEPTSSGAAVGQPNTLARVQAEFFSRPSIRHSDIGVSASGGVVTLTGRARNDALRQEALSVARSTPGVERVEDQIKVDESTATASSGQSEQRPPIPAPQIPSSSGQAAPPPVAAPQGDDWIEAQIQAKFFTDPLMKNSSVSVRASDGKVTLDGQVSSQEAREKALALARQTSGVTDVVDGLTVGR